LPRGLRGSPAGRRHRAEGVFFRHWRGHPRFEKRGGIPPLACGDKLKITVSPALLSENSFAIRYEVIRLGHGDKVAARVRTEHVCTSRQKRERAPLPSELLAWIKAG